jgi:hypothetical protein
MQDYKVNIFKRVIKRKMGKQDKTATVIIDENYPNLTDTEKNEILSKI